MIPYFHNFLVDQSKMFHLARVVFPMPPKMLDIVGYLSVPEPFIHNKYTSMNLPDPIHTGILWCMDEIFFVVVVVQKIDVASLSCDSKLLYKLDLYLTLQDFTNLDSKQGSQQNLSPYFYA
jgi:hypothetical protein